MGLHLELDENLISFGSNFIFIELISRIVWLVSSSIFQLKHQDTQQDKFRQIFRDRQPGRQWMHILWDEGRRE